MTEDSKQLKEGLSNTEKRLSQLLFYPQILLLGGVPDGLGEIRDDEMNTNLFILGHRIALLRDLVSLGTSRNGRISNNVKKSSLCSLRWRNKENWITFGNHYEKASTASKSVFVDSFGEVVLLPIQ